MCDVIDILIPDPLEEKQQTPIWAPEREVTMESAVTGALENAFWQMVGWLATGFDMPNNAV